MQLASPEQIARLCGHGWDDLHMTAAAMCVSDDKLDVTSCDYHNGFNVRYNVYMAGLHRINWCLLDFTGTV